MKLQTIAIAATAIAVGSTARAPRIAQATPITVSAIVASIATIATVSDSSTTGWTGAAAVAAPFTVAVTSNDPAGYTFTFTGTNATDGAFEADGTTTPSNVIDYTVTGTDGDASTYTNGVAGTVTYPGPTSGAVDSTFNVVWPVRSNVVADTYTDTIQATVNTL